MENLYCEIFRVQWPKKIKFKNEIPELITLLGPDLPYMIFEKPSTDFLFALEHEHHYPLEASLLN